MAKIINDEAITTIKNHLNAYSAVSFINVESNNQKYVRIANLLTSVGILSEKSATTALHTVKGSSTSLPVLVVDLDTDDLLSVIPEVALEDNMQSKGSTTGAVYIPLLDSFGCYYKGKGVIKLTPSIILSPAVSEVLLVSSVPILAKFAGKVIGDILKHDAEVASAIPLAMAERGFTDGVKAGDTVRIMPYTELVSRYGEIVIPANEDGGAETSIVLSKSKSYGYAFLKAASYLSEYSATVVSIDKTSGEVFLSFTIGGKTVTSITELRDSEGQVIYLAEPLRFHETHLVKA